MFRKKGAGNWEITNCLRPYSQSGGRGGPRGPLRAPPTKNTFFQRGVARGRERLEGRKKKQKHPQKILWAYVGKGRRENFS